MSYESGPLPFGEQPPVSGEGTTDSKNKKKKKVTRPLGPPAEGEAVLLDRRAKEQSEDGAAGKPTEGSLYDRLMPRPPKREAERPSEAAEKQPDETDTEPAGDHSMAEEEPAETDELLTQEAVVEKVLGPDYEEVTPGNLEKTVAEYADERKSELQQEREALSPERAEELAAIAYVEKFLQDAKKNVSQSSRGSAKQAASRSVGEAIETAAEAVAAQAWREHGPDESVPGVSLSEALDNTMGTSEDSPAIDYEDIDDLTGAHTSVHAVRRAGAAGSPPPGFGPGGFGPGGRGGRGQNSWFGRGPAAPTPQFESYEPTPDPRNTVPLVLLAGVAGLWIGNRHGKNKERKAAEARMLPLREKLKIEQIEHQAVRAQMAKKESQIREMVREHARYAVAADAKLQESSNAAEVSRQPMAEAPPKPLFERLAESAPLAVTAAAVETPTTRGRESPIEPAAAAERPKVTSLVEAIPARPPGMPERPGERPAAPDLRGTETAPPAAIPRRETAARPPIPAEAMSQKELIEAGDDIKIGPVSITSIYRDQHGISERGLRRIIAEHQRGGDIRQILKEEMIIKESGYERDPKLRDRPLSAGTGTAGASRAAEQHVPQQPPAAEHGMDNDTPLLPPPPRHPLLTAHQQSPVPSALVVATVAAFVVLAVLFVVWLLILLLT